jgi:hypothetical protein
VARALARTLWHAHFDVEAVLDDARAPAVPGEGMLRETRVALVRAEGKRIEIELTTLGNDDVAGKLAHEVGRAFVAGGTDDHPFRATDGDIPEPALGSIAAVYLGLGVVAANAAYHSRSAGELVGRTAYHEHRVDVAGGLDARDLAFLLAVQATASAPSEPRPVVARGKLDERALTQRNLGRVRERDLGGAMTLGTVGGSLAGVVAGVVIAGDPVFIGGGTVLGLIGGAIYGRVVRRSRCTGCGCYVKVSDAECRRCGGRFEG